MMDGGGIIITALSKIRRKEKSAHLCCSLTLLGLVFSLLSPMILTHIQLASQARPLAPPSLQDKVQSSHSQEYLFSELGLLPPVLTWEGIGSFSQVLNETFDLNNHGPVLLLLEFIVQGDKPTAPGYRLKGSFNDETFEVLITRAQLSYMITSGEPQELVLPMKANARFLLNHFYLNISCSMETSQSSEGQLIILGTSKFLVGNVMVFDSYGKYAIQTFPAKFKGFSSIGSGMAFKSFIQITIENESLVYRSKYLLTLVLLVEGQVSISLAIKDKNNQVAVMDKNTTAENTLVASATLIPYFGVSIYELDVTIFGSTLWSTEFEVSITSSEMLLYKIDRLFGFDTLELPFFVWPSIPIVGVLILLLWFFPYSFLKYREWKKAPNELAFVAFEDDDPFNILDPEGLVSNALDEDDDFDDTYESLEDDD